MKIAKMSLYRKKACFDSLMIKRIMF